MELCFSESPTVKEDSPAPSPQPSAGAALTRQTSVNVGVAGSTPKEVVEISPRPSPATEPHQPSYPPPPDRPELFLKLGSERDESTSTDASGGATDSAAEQPSNKRHKTDHVMRPEVWGGVSQQNPQPFAAAGGSSDRAGSTPRYILPHTGMSEDGGHFASLKVQATQIESSQNA